MAPVPFLKVRCESYVSFSCCVSRNCCLITEPHFLEGILHQVGTVFFLQLHSFGCCGVAVWTFERMFLFFDGMTVFILGIHE